MTVTQIVMGLGSWELALSDETPDYIADQLGFFGHIAVIDGEVDVERTGDNMLTGARYVGVLREKDSRTGRILGGSGMAYWLGDEDGKSHLIENELNLSGKTFVQAVTAVLALDISVVLGTVETRPGTLPAGSVHRYKSPREVLTEVCEAFGAEYRVNGNGSVDAGTAAFLYNTEAPDTIIVRKGAGSDLDMTALGGTFETQETVYDYTTRALLLGSTTPAEGEESELFATGSADAPSVPYLDLFGHPVVSTRAISESGTTTGTVAQRAQLALNRFSRVARSLKLNADEFDTEGNFVVGDNVWVYDPDTGIVNTANEVKFQAQVWHPESIRSTGMTWPVIEGYTVAFRTHLGAWVDLTPFVVWETTGTDVTVGDLPKTLSGGGDSVIQQRVDTARATGSDTTIPNPPTGLTVTAFSGLNPVGVTVSILAPSWTAPTLNTDSTVLTDLSHYVVRYRWTARTVWQQVTVPAGTTSVEIGVSAGLPYEVQVAAVDLAGHVSAFTSSVILNSAQDAVAPPAPADPVVTSYLGQLRIEYTGLSAAATAMPTDTNRVDVHVGTTSSFTATTATRVASLSPFGKQVAYATAPYSATDNRWVRLIAYDHAGNVSPSSAAVGGHTVQVGDGDIANLSVGKLTTGTISTDVIVAGNVLTALTGQRSGMTALGFQAWDAANNQTILLNGVANLLTGTLQTALAGQRRIVIGASGSTGKIQFTAPDGTSTEIGAFTGFGVGTEAIRMGLIYPTLSPFWGKIQFQNSGFGAMFLWAETQKVVIGGNTTGTGSFRINWATDKGTVADNTVPDESRFAVLDSGIYVDTPNDGIFRVAQHVGAITRDRFMVDTNSVNIYANTGGPRAEFQNLLTKLWHGPQASTGWMEFWPGQISGGGAYESNYIKLLTPTSPTDLIFGAIVKFVRYSGGNPGIEIVNANNTGFENIKAADFVVSSSETVKENIRDFGSGAMDRLRSVKVKRFTRKSDPDQREQVGVIAEMVPEELRLPGGEFGPMVSGNGLTAMTLAALQEIDARLDALEKGKKP